jgi:hypothetical protein
LLSMSIEPRFLRRPPLSLVTLLSKLFWLQQRKYEITHAHCCSAPDLFFCPSMTDLKVTYFIALCLYNRFTVTCRRRAPNHRWGLVGGWVFICVLRFRFFEVLSLFNFLRHLYSKAECRHDIKLKQDNRYVRQSGGNKPKL